ncbi:MAG: hypothetical protein Q6373_021725 [Candidatus Sigynarchaeota archaeon]
MQKDIIINVLNKEWEQAKYKAKMEKVIVELDEKIVEKRNEIAMI